MSRVLITGFEPFDKSSMNPSQVIVERLRSMTITGAELVCEVLPVAFDAAATELTRLIDLHEPAVVIALGQAEGRTHITPERIAVNLDDARIPDNTGDQRTQTRIIADSPETYASTLPVERIVANLTASGIEAAPSDSAGAFVCNHVFYVMQHHCRGRGIMTGFVHVPLMAEQAPEFPGLPTMLLDDLVLGIRKVVETVISHPVRVHRSSEHLPREAQLAWRLAELATDRVPIDADVADMVANRIIDNAAVAIASLMRAPVIAARDQALAHLPRRGRSGATIFGLAPETRVTPEWAAWANGVAVRELDYHDTFLAADYSHPADNIPPLVAVAQHLGIGGADLLHGIVTAYEVQMNLVRRISLHKHKIDHVAHLGPSVAAGLGTMLRLPTERIYHAIGQALHTTTSTRQSRKGEISTWKAYAPAFAGKVAIEAVDRAMRGQTSPSPIYEGEDGVIAWLLDGPDAQYEVLLPAHGEPKRAILESYTKEHSAEYQAQALIDLARRMHHAHPEVTDPDNVDQIVIHTSHHTHYVIGSGANDPQKYDPLASRETLDHSIPYIFAVALQDAAWHHERSYARERATRTDTVALWHKITTQEDPHWTAKYHATDPDELAFGGRVEIRMQDGRTIVDEIDVADAHPRGARPFGRAEYVAKFRTLTEAVVEDVESERFLALVQDIAGLSAADIVGLNVVAKPGVVGTGGVDAIF